MHGGTVEHFRQLIPDVGRSIAAKRAEHRAGTRVIAHLTMATTGATSTHDDLPARTIIARIRQSILLVDLNRHDSTNLAAVAK